MENAKTLKFRADYVDTLNNIKAYFETDKHIIIEAGTKCIHMFRTIYEILQWYKTIDINDGKIEIRCFKLFTQIKKYLGNEEFEDNEKNQRLLHDYNYIWLIINETTINVASNIITPSTLMRQIFNEILRSQLAYKILIVARDIELYQNKQLYLMMLDSVYKYYIELSAKHLQGRLLKNILQIKNNILLIDPFEYADFLVKDNVKEEDEEIGYKNYSAKKYSIIDIPKQNEPVICT
ncbi:MAG: hypothetical protein ACYCPT_13570, partial [Acidimicrobiales bacterium]